MTRLVLNGGRPARIQSFHSTCIGVEPGCVTVCFCVAVTAKLFVQHACRTSINPNHSHITSSTTFTHTHTHTHTLTGETNSGPNQLAIKAAELELTHTRTHKLVQVNPSVMALIKQLVIVFPVLQSHNRLNLSDYKSMDIAVQWRTFC